MREPRGRSGVPVIEDDGVLAGQLWGVVNYHPDKCADLPEHWHVVWQRGAELLRSFVYPTIDHGEFWPEAGDRLVTAAVHEDAVHGDHRPVRRAAAARSRPGPVQLRHQVRARHRTRTVEIMDADLAAAVEAPPSWTVEGQAAVYAPPGAHGQVRAQPVLLAQKRNQQYAATIMQGGVAVYTTPWPTAASAVQWAERARLT